MADPERPSLDALRRVLRWAREPHLLIADDLRVVEAFVGDLLDADDASLAGRRVVEILTPELALVGGEVEREVAEGLWREALDSPDSSLGSGGLVVHSEGKWFEAVSHAIEDESLRGPGPRWLVKLRDVSEERRRDRARERAELAIEAAEKGLWDLDGRTGEMYLSPRFEEIFGYAPGEMMRDLDLYRETHVHPDDRGTMQEAWRRLLEEEGRKPAHIEYRSFRLDGEERWIDSRTVTVVDAEGRAVRMAGSIDDITDRKRAADERVLMERKLQDFQKLESLGVLAGGIAHDFNNLLTGILGNCNLAQMSLPEHADVQGDLREIEQAALRAAELCQQMLAYSGRGHFAVHRLDLGEIARETSKLLAASLPNSVDLQLELDEDAPMVEADASQLRQVVTSLLFNASEALAESAGTIRVRTAGVVLDGGGIDGVVMPDEPPPGRYTLLEVRDEGVGMDPEMLSRIFDPFFTTKFTGRGLGLAAVLGIVRGHQGAVHVESTPGEGSIFRVYLPSVEGEHAEEVVATGAPSREKGGTLLVVDDEEMIRLLASRILEKEGFRVIVARDGFEGVARFREEADRVVAVLLDLTMPNMDGVETFHELRRLAPDLTVVMMSGFSEDDVLADGGERLQGLAGFIKKPFQATSLRSKIRSALG